MVSLPRQRDHGGHVRVDADTLATALDVKIDDELKASPQLNRYRPKIAIAAKITDAELITVAVLQVLLGHHNEIRSPRRARKDIGHLFPYLPQRPGYNKRLRALVPQLAACIAALAADTHLWQHPIRIADSTPVQCGTSHTTAHNFDAAGDGRQGAREPARPRGELRDGLGERPVRQHPRRHVQPARRRGARRRVTRWRAAS
jgi:hypothetical protein